MGRAKQKAVPIVQLSDARKRELALYDVDWELVVQCAYYPYPKCKVCKFDVPNPECARAHILVDTRISGKDKKEIKARKMEKWLNKLNSLFMEVR